MQNSSVQIITSGYKGQQNHLTNNDSNTTFTQLLTEGMNGKIY